MKVERDCDAFARMREEARLLPDLELRRHAKVARNNRCHCFSCYCCACDVVLREREEAAWNLRKAKMLEKNQAAGYRYLYNKMRGC